MVTSALLANQDMIEEEFRGIILGKRLYREAYKYIGHEDSNPYIHAYVTKHTKVTSPEPLNRPSF